MREGMGFTRKVGKPYDITKSQGRRLGLLETNRKRSETAAWGKLNGDKQLLKTGQHAQGPTCHKGIKGKPDNIILILQLKKLRHKVLR